MLDWEIQIMADLRFFFHYLYQIVINLFRITVQKADPADSFDLT